MAKKKELRERQGKEQQRERKGKLVERATGSEVDRTVPWHTVVAVGNGAIRRPNALNGRERRPMELGEMVTHPSQSVVADPGSSVSQRVQVVNSSPVSPACWCGCICGR